MLGATNKLEKSNDGLRIRKSRVATSVKSHNPFEEIMLEQLNSHMKKKRKLELYLIVYTKINLEWLIDLNIKAKL